MVECNFLYTYYPDIFRGLRGGTLDANVVLAMLDNLQKIEDGTHDQHTASYCVGHLLKTMYVDGALRRRAQDASSASATATTTAAPLSYRDFKRSKAAAAAAAGSRRR